jgi:hypothetical protein
LIYANDGKEIFHIHIATDFQNHKINIITAYKPTLDKWEKDFKTRK